jgi:glutaminase
MSGTKEPEMTEYQWRNRDGQVVDKLPAYGKCPEHFGIAEIQADGSTIIRGAAPVLFDGCTVDGCRHNRKAKA